MRELYSEIEIETSAERVWQLLTDFRWLPKWNPFMQHAAGQLKPGEKIEVYLQPPKGSGMAFKPTVTKVEPNRELRWLGHFILPGLFDGEHIFVIQVLDANRVRFIQREEFKGLLVPLLLRWVGENTRRGFESMNQALKAEAEKPEA